MIRVLIVDDSITSRHLLRHIVESAPDMQVVAELQNGQQAVEQITQMHPDVILMDIVMPKVDGLEATSEIMAVHPVPIVMISGTLQGRETEMAFQAIKKGALTLLEKPSGPGDPTFEEQAARLTSTLRAMAGVRVIHHAKPDRKTKSEHHMRLQPAPSKPPEVVGIVASTGGPAALAEIFQKIPESFSLPIVVVQHIAGDFLDSLVSWLSHVSPLKVRLAQKGEAPQRGNIYFAPFGKHLYFDANRRFAFTRMPVVHHIPSGDMLFESIALQYREAAVGVILTGMGADGAHGLYKMYQQGAVTIAQDESTSAVYGMPSEARRLGGVQHVLPLNTIAPMLNDLAESEHL